MENQKVIVVGDPSLAKTALREELERLGHDNIEFVEPKNIDKNMVTDFSDNGSWTFDKKPIGLYPLQDDLFYQHFPNHPPVPQYRRSFLKISRNAPCPCGSGKKNKRCCNK